MVRYLYERLEYLYHLLFVEVDKVYGDNSDSVFFAVISILYDYVMMKIGDKQ